MIIEADLNLLDASTIPQSNSSITMHFFANILDILDINIFNIISAMEATQGKRNIVIIVSPYIWEKPNDQINYFSNYFRKNYQDTFKQLSMRICKKGETCKECEQYLGRYCNKRFVNRQSTRHEVIFEYIADPKIPRIRELPSSYYIKPSVEFKKSFDKVVQAAYAPDSIISDKRYVSLREYIDINSIFFLYTQSIDENNYSKHCSVYAVLANQVMRGSPTFIPIDLAEIIYLKNSPLFEKRLKYGAIDYYFKDDWPVEYNLLSKEQNAIIIQGIEIAWIQLSILLYLIHNDFDLPVFRVRGIGFQHRSLKYAVLSLREMFKNMEVLTGSDLPKIEAIENPQEADSVNLVIKQTDSISSSDLSTLKTNVIFLGKNSFTARERVDSVKYYSRSLVRYKNIFDIESDSYSFDLIDSLKYFLKTLFRKESFLSGQLDVLKHIMKLDSVIGLLPTGGGKSLIYQFGALMQPGFVFVIEPIKSLMKDQYDEMQLLGINSIFINSSLTIEERDYAEYQMISGQSLFTLISPERLQIQRFRNAIMDMTANENYFSFFVVDEAHCVSEWGHDFRSSYLRLAANANRYCKPFDGGDINVIGLTATASFDVLSDVHKELEINPQKSIIIEKAMSLKRDEIVYKFIDVELLNSKKTKRAIYNSKRNELLRIIGEKLEEDINEINKNLLLSDDIVLGERDKTIHINNNTGIIVFCPHTRGQLGVDSTQSKVYNRTGVYELLEDTFEHTGLKAGYYRGSTRDKIKEAEMNHFQKQFKDNEINLMVATKAFGMGFNKPNIRFSIHMNYPGSLEGFAQETGRIGRDRKLALAYLLYSEKDKEVPKFLHDRNYMDIDKEVELSCAVLSHKFDENSKSINDCLKLGSTSKVSIVKIDSSAKEFKKHLNVTKNYENQFAKVIYRLTLIGILDDYTIQYRYAKSSVYYAVICPKERKDIESVLREYLSRYYTQLKTEQMVKDFYKSCDYKPTYRHLIRYYINFEHSFIKKKREQAIDDMEFACKYGLEQQKTEMLSESFREYIDAYFSSKYFRENHELSDGSNASLTLATDRGKEANKKIVLDFINIIIDDDGGILQNCKELRGACIRLLNDNPNNFSLRMLNGFSNLVASQNKALEFNHGTVEIIKGLELFFDDKDVDNSYEKALSLIGKVVSRINEEIIDFEEHFKKATKMKITDLVSLVYFAQQAHILQKTIKGE